MTTLEEPRASGREGGATAPALEQTSSGRLRSLARSTPERLALRVGDRVLTYAELDRAAEALAARLLADLGEGDDAVGLQCQGTEAMFVGALGIARAGKVSVPLDPGAPAERVTLVLADVAAGLLLSDVEAPGPAGVPTAHPLEHAAPAPVGGVGADLGPVASVVFTSGSTGVPKGIVVPRSHRVNLAASSFFAAVQPIEEGSLVGALAAGTVGFAESLVHIVVQLGLTLDAYEIKRLGLAPLAGWLERSGIMGFVTVPTVLRYFLPTLEPGTVFGSLELVALTGETSTWEDVRQLRAHLPESAVVYNCFGLTEVNGISVFPVTEVPEGASGPLPAGWPLPGAVVRIVGEDGHEVAAGERGEIVVEGPGCTLGYWNRPELSARTFSVLPDGTRRVRTGDGGRFGPDGLLEHLGRLDHLVKISGNRVELGEIEACLQGMEGVAAATAVPYEDGAGNTRLLAFVVPLPEQSLDPWVLRALVARRLPGPMLPDRIEVLAELPQLPNGKVDRRTLAGRHGAAPAGPEEPGDAPGGLTQQLASLFGLVLELEEVGPDDNFFSLGGDSLRAARLFVELEARCGIVRPMSLLLEAATPRLLAGAIEAGAAALGLLVPIQVEGSQPPLFVVHDGIGDVYYAARLAERLGPDRPVYAIQCPLFQGEDAPERSIEELAARYLAEVRRLRPEGPYLLYGFSLGGTIAFEMARQLQAAGQQVAFLGLGDSSAPARPAARRAAGRLAELRELRPSEALRRAGQLAAAQARHLRDRSSELLDQGRRAELARLQETDPASMERGDRVLYHYGAMSAGYRPTRPFEGSVLLIRSGGPGARPDRGWGPLVTGAVLARDVPGEHNQLGKEPYAAAVGDEVARALGQLASQA